MAPDILGEAGLHWDEPNKRGVGPRGYPADTALQEEGKVPVDRTGQFQEIVGGFLQFVDQLTKEAENGKMKAKRCSNQNLLESTAKQKAAQQLQLQALVAEEKMQLERHQGE